MATSIDSGFPKKLWVCPSGYGNLDIGDVMRDRFGYFWVCGFYQETGANYLPMVWKFDSTYTLADSWEIGGTILDKTQKTGCTSLAIDSDDRIHVVGVFRNTSNKRRIFYTNKDGGDCTADFADAVEISTKDASYHQTLYYPTTPTIAINEYNKLVVVSAAQGWDPGYEDYYRLIARARSAGSWGDWVYDSFDDTNSYVRPHLTAVRDLNTSLDKYKVFLERENPTNEYILYAFYMTGTSIDIQEIRADYFQEKCESGWVRCAFDYDDQIYIVAMTDAVDDPVLRPTFAREDASVTSWPDYPETDPGQTDMKTLAFNDSKLLAVYERTSEGHEYVRRRENLDSGSPGTWDSETQITTSKTFTRGATLSRAFPVVNSKRFSLPTAGFAFIAASNDALCGDGETQPGIYFYAIDNLTWPSPDAPDPCITWTWELQNII